MGRNQETARDVIRPVMTRDQVMGLNERIMAMTSADTVRVFVRHTARNITRLTDSRLLAGDDGDVVDIRIITKYGGREQVSVATNQITESSLRAIVYRCEAMARQQ